MAVQYAGSGKEKKPIKPIKPTKPRPRVKSKCKSRKRGS